MSESKRCTKCGEAKALEAFPPAKAKRDKRSSWCRLCHRTDQKARYVVHSETFKTRVATYKQTHRSSVAEWGRRRYAKDLKTSRARSRAHQARYAQELRDSYVRALFRQDGISNAPAEMLAAKRAHLKVTRLLKEKAK